RLAGGGPPLHGGGRLMDRARPEPLRVARLAWLFFRVGAMSELQYRVNFVLQVFHSFLALWVGLAVLALVFSHPTGLRGWTRPAPARRRSLGRLRLRRRPRPRGPDHLQLLAGPGLPGVLGDSDMGDRRAVRGRVSGGAVAGGDLSRMAAHGVDLPGAAGLCHHGARP